MLLNWVVVFLILSLVAGGFGFFGLAAESAGIAKILFFIFLVLFVGSLVLGFLKRKPRA
jgi:uncharacterized membrane protein YtjA (UPF0391 family)